MRILVVEDEQDMNRLILKTLKRAGYSVDGCLDGEEALHYLEGTEYDAVLLDVMLPKRTAMSWCSRCVKRDRIPRCCS